jgi:hypothetical protein
VSSSSVNKISSAINRSPNKSHLLFVVCCCLDKKLSTLTVPDEEVPAATLPDTSSLEHLRAHVTSPPESQQLYRALRVAILKHFYNGHAALFDPWKLQLLAMHGAAQILTSLPYGLSDAAFSRALQLRFSDVLASVTDPTCPACGYEFEQHNNLHVLSCVRYKAGVSLRHTQLVKRLASWLRLCGCNVLTEFALPDDSHVRPDLVTRIGDALFLLDVSVTSACLPAFRVRLASPAAVLSEREQAKQQHYARLVSAVQTEHPHLRVVVVPAIFELSGVIGPAFRRFLRRILAHQLAVHPLLQYTLQDVEQSLQLTLLQFNSVAIDSVALSLWR